ncbi:hypothetical protein Chor_002140 [Crotalus horridus]
MPWIQSLGVAVISVRAVAPVQDATPVRVVDPVRAVDPVQVAAAPPAVVLRLLLPAVLLPPTPAMPTAQTSWLPGEHQEVPDHPGGCWPGGAGCRGRSSDGAAHHPGAHGGPSRKGSFYSMQLLHMTIDELDGEESQLKFSIDKEEVATYYVDGGIHNPAIIIYDFAKLLIGYKPEHQKTCYITRMDKENVQGVDALLQEFQTKLSVMHLMSKRKEQAHEEFFTSQVDRSNLGTTINVLCKHIPIFYT